MKNKLGIVTGGTRGIGLGVVKKLIQEGYIVYAVGTRDNYKDYDEFSAFKDENNLCRYIRCDVSNEEDRKNLVERVIKEEGKIDLLVNNAGVAPKVRDDILKMSQESMDYVLDINLKGAFFLTQLVANEMIGSSTQGVIINISSISSDTSSTNRGEYCISKAGLSMVTMLFADRLAEYGIHVYEIRPGMIRTDMVEKVADRYDDLIKNTDLVRIKRWGLPEDVAKGVWAFANGSFPYSTGSVIEIDGGFHIKRL